MYYQDEDRRFNFLSGLICGSVLGAGLAMLVAPQKGVLPPLSRRGRGRAASGVLRPVIRVLRRPLG
jgi:hypothetical protein